MDRGRDTVVVIIVSSTKKRSRRPSAFPERGTVFQIVNIDLDAGNAPATQSHKQSLERKQTLELIQLQIEFQRGRTRGLHHSQHRTTRQEVR